jgi:NAD(P)-dependent dehydrogenase (short-subunit alcohol dehydrogenase family)
MGNNNSPSGARGIIIVTGATGNLGLPIVKKFIDEGYKVIGTAMANDPTVIHFPADKFEKIDVDLMNEDDSAKFVNDIAIRYGSIDAAVLTVGGFALGSVVETKTSEILKQYKLNFETAYNVARPVFTQMIKQNTGRILFIGSKPGLSAGSGKGMIAYGLAKSLIFRLAELMNDEAKGTNVVTSVVVPSTIDTPQNRKAMPDADPSKWVTPEQIADVVHFYCTEKAAVLREPVIKAYNNS